MQKGTKYDHKRVNIINIIRVSKTIERKWDLYKKKSNFKWNIKSQLKYVLLSKICM